MAAGLSRAGHAQAHRRHYYCFYHHHHHHRKKHRGRVRHAKDNARTAPSSTLPNLLLLPHHLHHHHHHSHHHPKREDCGNPFRESQAQDTGRITHAPRRTPRYQSDSQSPRPAATETPPLLPRSRSPPATAPSAA
eukprot:3710645-Rhodomonas_salina.1